MTRNLPTITDKKFNILLWKCGRRCQHETWDPAAYKHVRCEREHLGQQQDGRKGPVQLTAVSTDKGVQLYCQKHALESVAKSTSDWAQGSP